MQRKTKVSVLAGLGGSAVALLATASPALAAGNIITPTPGPNGTYTVPVDSSGNPLNPFGTPPGGFDIKVSGYTGNVFIEICDGVSPGSKNYDPNAECDNTTSPATHQAANSSQVLDYPAGDQNFGIAPFRGASPNSKFNCLAPEDVKAGTTPAADGSVTPVGATTTHGNDAIAPGRKSWTNCQLRIANSLTMVGGTDAYLTLNDPNTGGGPPPATPEVPVAILLPLGAVALLGGGYALNRKRHSADPAA